MSNRDWQRWFPEDRDEKQRLVHGPSQIESWIQQDTIITEQLALWSRGGSKVMRGNLMIVALMLTP